MSIITGENVDLAQLANDVRWAFLVTDAAIPLGRVMQPRPDVSSGIRREGELTEAQSADRSALRAIAFKSVLRELMACDYEISDEGEQALREGQMPAEPEED